MPIRAGSDIVFLGALINHILRNDLYFAEYVRAYTNAATIINEEFRDTEDFDGVFSGYDPSTGAYDQSSWAYVEADDAPSVDADDTVGEAGPEEHGRSKDDRGEPETAGAGGPRWSTAGSSATTRSPTRTASSSC